MLSAISPTPGTERIQSDNLAALREILGALPVLATNLGVPESVRLVLDASVLVAEVRWLVKKRRNADARTALQEALASGTVVAFAPTYLDEEMHRQLAAVSEEEHISHEALTSTWTQYKRSLLFYDAGSPGGRSDASTVDPKDLPYVEVYLAVGAAAIMTADPHLRRMGARTVEAELSLKIRSYARDASVDFTLRAGGLLVGSAALGGGIVLWKSAIMLARAFAKLPSGAQLVLVACLIGIWAYRPARDRLLRDSRGFSNGLRTLLADAVPLVAQMVSDSRAKQLSARRTWSEIHPRFETSHVPVRAHALAVCAASSQALTIDEIIEKLRRVGARTSAVTFPKYLRRVLRSHPRLMQTADGRWTVAPRPRSFDHPCLKAER